MNQFQTTIGSMRLKGSQISTITFLVTRDHFKLYVMNMRDTTHSQTCLQLQLHGVRKTYDRVLLT